MSLNKILTFSVFKHLVTDLSKDKGTKLLDYLLQISRGWSKWLFILLYPF